MNCRFFPAIRRLSLVLVSLLFAATVGAAAGKNAAKLPWEAWTDDVFTRATAQNKLVVLNLKAVWCHWCHVMEQETYANKEIAGLLRKNFILTEVDQDSRPDLSNRYRKYGWPATIIFSSQGVEIAKRAGFIPPAEMKVLLERLVANPIPQDDEIGGADILYSETPQLPKAIREKIIERHYSAADPVLGGLKLKHRYIDPDTLEYSLVQASRGNSRDTEMYKRTLRYNLKLIDPVWGGVYQYSAYRDWDHPHYEKIMSSQSNNVRIYARAYALTHDPIYLTAAMNVYRYVKDFLTGPDGALYVSQDADVKPGEHSLGYFSLGDAARRAIGVPRVDTNVYARENGWMITALAALYEASGNAAILADAVGAAEAMIERRSLPDGGFRHGEADPAGPYLDDTLAMGEGFLALYRVTAERKWLAGAESAGRFIEKNFIDAEKTDAPGILTAARRAGSALEPIRVLDENVRAARFFNLLRHFTGSEEYRRPAEIAMRYAATEDVAFRSLTEPGIVTADEELASAPLHLTVVGAKSDETAQRLFQEGLRYFSVYKRMEWWDQAEGPLPNPDVQFPQVEKAAAFVCTDRRCSLPIFDPSKVKLTIDFVLNNKAS